MWVEGLWTQWSVDGFEAYVAQRSRQVLELCGQRKNIRARQPGGVVGQVSPRRREDSNNTSTDMSLPERSVPV